MAATALDVLPLATVRAELRFDNAETSQDALLTLQIEAAVDFVARDTGLPLLDTTDTVFAPPPGADDRPLCVMRRHLRDVTALHYWPPDATLQDEPTEFTRPGGRTQTIPDGMLLYSTAPWPDVLEGTLFRATVDVGLAAIPPSLAQAAVLAVRQLYAGYREIRPTEAFFALIAPWRRYD